MKTLFTSHLLIVALFFTAPYSFASSDKKEVPGTFLNKMISSTNFLTEKNFELVDGEVAEYEKKFLVYAPTVWKYFTFVDKESNDKLYAKESMVSEDNVILTGQGSVGTIDWWSGRGTFVIVRLTYIDEKGNRIKASYENGEFIGAAVLKPVLAPVNKELWGELTKSEKLSHIIGSFIVNLIK